MFLLLLSFTLQFSHAQVDQLFTPINVLEATFTENELLLYQHYAQSIDYSSVQLVQIGNLESIQQNGILNFTLPGENFGTLTAEATKVEWNDDTDFGWTGKIGDNGSLIFMSQPEGQIASIYVQENTFSLLPIKPNIGVILKHDANTTAGTCGDLDLEEPPSEPPSCSYDDCDAVITVLFLITPPGQQNLMGQSGNNPWLYLLRLKYTEWHINSVFANSLIANKSVRIITKFFDHLPPSGLTQSQILSAIPTSQVYPFYGWVRSERQAEKADLTFVIHEAAWNPGIAFSFPTEKAYGYGLLRAGNFFNTFAFPHELGHLFGCLHEWASDNRSNCAHADDIIGRTILWSIVNPTIIPFYSNPDIGTGTDVAPEQTMNAQKIMSNGCMVADYYDNQDWTVSISGPDYSCDHNPVTYSVNTNNPPTGNPGQPPYYYDWAWTSNGFFSTSNPGISLGTSPTVTIGSLDCPFFFLRVRVTSSDGVIRYATRKIVTQDNCPECPEIDAKFSNGKNEVHTYSPTLEVVPNPATDDFEVKFELPELENTELTLYNHQGQVIAVLHKGKLEGGQHKLYFNKAGILAGSYVLRLRTEQSVIARKFVIFE